MYGRDFKVTLFFKGKQERYYYEQEMIIDGAFIWGNSKTRFLIADEINTKKNTARVFEISNKNIIPIEYYNKAKKALNINLSSIKLITTQSISERLNGIPVHLEDWILSAQLNKDISVILNPARTKPYNFEDTLNTWVDNVKLINTFINKPMAQSYLKFIQSFGDPKIEFTALTLNSFKFFKKLVNTFDESSIIISKNRVTEILNTLSGFLYKVSRGYGNHYTDYYCVPALTFSPGYINITISRSNINIKFFNNSLKLRYVNGKKTKGKLIDVNILGESKKVKVSFKMAKILSYIDSIYLYEETLEYFEKKKLLGSFVDY